MKFRKKVCNPYLRRYSSSKIPCWNICSCGESGDGESGVFGVSGDTGDEGTPKRHLAWSIFVVGGNTARPVWTLGKSLFWLSMIGDGVRVVGIHGGESSILNGLIVILGESKTIWGESNDLVEIDDGDGPGLNTSSSSSEIALHKYRSRSVLSNLKTCSTAALPWIFVVPGMDSVGGRGGGSGPPKIPLITIPEEEEDDEELQLASAAEDDDDG